MKIKAKLAIGFSLLLLLLIGITSFGYQRLSQMNHSISHFYDNRFEKVTLALAVRGEVNAAARVMNDMILGEEVKTDGVQDITTRLTNAGEQFKTLSTLELDNAEQVEVADIKQTSTIYGTTLKEFIGLINGNKIDEARSLYTKSLRDQQRKVIDSLDQLVKLQEDAMKVEMKDSRELYSRSVRMVAIIIVFGLLMGTGIVFWVFPSITSGLNMLGGMADRFAKGKLRSFNRVEIKSKDELGELAHLFKRIALDLHNKNEREALLSGAQQRQARMNAQIARVTELLHAGSDAKAAAQLFISEFAPVLGANYGVIYLDNPLAFGGLLELSGSYAISGDTGEDGSASVPEAIRPGEGLAGQCFKDGKTIVLDGMPSGYVKVGSALGETEAKSLIVHPILNDHRPIGVIEVASVSGFDSENRELLVSLCDKLGTILNNITSRRRVEELLRESQAMTEELQVQSEELVSQQEELRGTNDKLELQQRDLKKSELRLQQQQEELEHTNQELTVKALDLEQHIRRVELQNRQIAQANSELERQALQLALASKYKSEFLANMSHELRTPLNSLLILSEFLAENKEGNLTDKQREYMRTIHLSGNDLLKMIDEILDLSKVDAGKMDIHPEWMVLDDISTFLSSQFGPMAESKNLGVAFEKEDDIPQAIWTDGHRIKQIMRNLLSNAIKFTESGKVVVHVRIPNEEELDTDRRKPGITYVALSVSDTGIGIPEEKRELIFEAFRQADGTTSRKYGGTGLGLTISRELAHLLEGWIHLEARNGGGSTFTLIIPERLTLVHASEEEQEGHAAGYAAVASEMRFSGQIGSEMRLQPAKQLEDDRNSLSGEDRVLLIVEDDINFANVLIEMARSRGFKAIVALRGDEGLEMARKYGPDAIILDIQLPVTDGWSILNELKSDPQMRHIPVHVVSVTEYSQQGLRMGAIDHLQKPANGEQLDRVFVNIAKVLDRKPKRLLLVEHDDELRDALTELIVHDDVDVSAVPDASTAWDRLNDETYDCIVLDSGLPADEAVELLARIHRIESLRSIPVIVYGDGEEDDRTIRRMRALSESIVLKDVKSPERLLEETTLFLHRLESGLPDDKRNLLNNLNKGQSTFDNKRILLVDDDVRNVFALTSVLEHRNMKVVNAENGVEALNKLEEDSEFDLILMDIMMPEMDGYEAITRIRQHPEWSRLPIIALTAKAMKDDRNKCIEAGASDYITKPVNTEQLLSLMRVWLHR
ncbi:response regulator [Cohnella endophytica]|uniref:Circadian input-output histidine kinase CikA n=1 Tax=Cohnella endophytica TaxID=2419778 RepID=A0A494XCH9_9BACL|nr:response regulator [Cohnella endophytica]RKP45844.1 response regulator [Cohnella endophytica]